VSPVSPHTGPATVFFRIAKRQNCNFAAIKPPRRR
jgi:hypothetical protein